MLISSLRVTLMECANSEVMNRESKFLRALEKSRRIEASHLALKLKTADGTLLLELARRDFD